MIEKEETTKPDCVLSDGTEVYFDKRNIKPREWKSLFDTEQPEEEAEHIMARFAGISFEVMHEASVYDSQTIYAAAIVKMREPVNPNSPSVSTSQS